MGQGEGQGKGKGHGAGVIWGVLWFFAIWFIGWPLAFFFASFYVLLLPFSVCCDPLKDACQLLLRIVQLPLTFAENMVAMKPMCR
ncbi:hypothetical protein ACJMK2_025484 [Sinanodonta woodiana]|uniref:Uncharacterized protein n=1 Tax=Sinanodonta woodiana TaxID=1069815 RepID=A0ABD3XGN7_SINWO